MYLNIFQFCFMLNAQKWSLCRKDKLLLYLHCEACSALLSSTKTNRLLEKKTDWRNVWPPQRGGKIYFLSWRFHICRSCLLQAGRYDEIWFLYFATTFTALVILDRSEFYKWETYIYIPIYLYILVSIWLLMWLIYFWSDCWGPLN